MKQSRLSTLCFAVALAALVAVPALAAAAAEPPAASPAAATTSGGAPEAKATAPTAEQKMMEAMMKAGTPGKPHQDLAKLAGSWSLAVKAWMKPGAPPQESKGTAERTMMLGGRVLSEKVTGDPMGPGMGPFEGFGLSGYDNVSGKYWGTWADNMGTGVMTSSGTCVEKTSTCTFKGSYMDPMTKKAKHVRMVDRMDGPDKSVMEFYETGKGGKEAKTMEITYTRKQ
jgi:Protein of unknown function (DUF1579)